MNVLFAAAEATPLIKVGGLADAVGALPAALRCLGHDVRIVMPCYRRLRDHLGNQYPIAAAFLPIGERQEQLRVYTTTLNDVPVYLLDIPAAFERDTVYGAPDDDRRFILFCRGILQLMLHLRDVEGWRIDLLHANDWHTGLVPNYLKTYTSYTFGQIATLYTVHNLAFQGVFNPFSLHLSGLACSEPVETLAGLGDCFNYMARGLYYADIVTTVSPTYANEILADSSNTGLEALLRTRSDRLFGILNGIDYDQFDPATDPTIAANYSVDDMHGKAICKMALQLECGFEVDERRPLIGMVTRLNERKGLDLFQQAMGWLLGSTDAQLVLLGPGNGPIVQAFASYMHAAPRRVRLYQRFDQALARRIYGGSDIFLMPSRSEPAGLGQLIALRYGAVPLVRAVGGLNDTVREGYEGNGFRFDAYQPAMLIDALHRCLTAFRDTRGWPMLRARGRREDYSWNASAREYAALYDRALRETSRY